LPISNYTKSLLSIRLQEKSSVVYPTVNDKWIELSKENQQKKDTTITFGTLSRLVERKGHAKVINMLSRLKGKFEFKYLVAGEGTEKDNIKKLIAEKNLEQCISVLGSLNDIEVIQFFKEIDVFIMLNTVAQDDVEGFGYVFVEAGLMGVPSIGGNNGGANEIIKNNQTGMLVNVENEKEILEVIESTYNDKFTWSKYGENCRSIYSKLYSSKYMSDSLRYILEKVLK
jgi:glycosyltransferase involved in cell wall biosynthesis